jgi:hypothetical protein
MNPRLTGHVLRPHASARGACARLGSAIAAIGLPLALLALGGCFGKHPGPWREATAQDLEVLRDHYKVDAGNREVVRRDVSVWFIGPASGYPEWGLRNGDGTIEIVKKPPTSTSPKP